eukprot:553289-Prorocentrum_minimum.AAC.1
MASAPTADCESEGATEGVGRGGWSGLGQGSGRGGGGRARGGRAAVPAAALRRVKRGGAVFSRGHRSGSLRESLCCIPHRQESGGSVQ